MSQVNNCDICKQNYDISDREKEKKICDVIALYYGNHVEDEDRIINNMTDICPDCIGMLVQDIFIAVNKSIKIQQQ